jgi:hypothetical protein
LPMMAATGKEKNVLGKTYLQDPKIVEVSAG